jgi:tRNA(Ile)-lysidine synthase
MANSRKSRSRNSQNKVQQIFERAIRDFLPRVCVSADGGPAMIGVAYSGGLDSTVLLFLASRFAHANGLAIRAFHVHHGLSSNADAWATHCVAQAGKLGVPLVMSNVSVSAGGRGIEEAARIARYHALGEMCRADGVSLLLAAHHQDDQAETVFLQLMRGAGLPGLSGMPAFQQRHELMGADVALGRPLLGVSRSDLEQVAQQFDLQHVSDESNANVRYRRNAFRHEIAPVITTHFPGFSELISRTATHAQAAQSLLCELAALDCQACRVASATDALDITKLRGMSAERFDNLLRYWLAKNGIQLPSTARLNELRLQLLSAAADTHPFLDFGEMRLHRIGNRIELHPDPGSPPSEPVVLKWRGEPELAVPEWRGKLIFTMTDGAGLDIEKLRSGQLSLRPRVGQERIKLAENRPSKTLKNLFQEAGITSLRRAWLPLLYLEDSLIFAAGVGMDSRRVIHGKTVALRWEDDAPLAL